jgi:membrane-bound serine protease (ClpP class)
MRFWSLVLALMGVLWTLPARAETYVHLRIDGVINPVKARYVERGLSEAARQHADFVVVSIDTPGGLVPSMEKITSAFTNSPVPIVGFVEPTSAQATSAGAFILLSTDIAAMAPHTRVGAAHPVAAGKNLEGAMDAKATNSLVSLAKSLAARRGRPESFGEAIVRDSASYTAEEAKKLGAVEIIAVNEAGLLSQLDGRKLELGGRELVIHSKDASAIVVDPSWSDELLDIVADPTVASMLLSLGVLGIVYELASPGIGMGGIVGVISLLTGLAAMSVLPLELGGILLLLVGFIAIAVEIKAQTHGMLAAGGVVALVLGALFLVDKGSYFGGTPSVNWWVFVPFIVAVTAGVVLLARTALRSQHERFRTGAEGLIGKHGRAKIAFEADGDRFKGSVFVDGARYEAVSPEPLADGDSVKVVEVLAEPTRLAVERIEEGAA